MSARDQSCNRRRRRRDIRTLSKFVQKWERRRSKAFIFPLISIRLPERMLEEKIGPPRSTKWASVRAVQANS
jgi:hypothetical protein